ncbi:hypothetical protein D3C83_123350 [compost metagenome]
MPLAAIIVAALVIEPEPLISAPTKPVPSVSTPLFVKARSRVSAPGPVPLSVPEPATPIVNEPPVPIVEPVTPPFHERTPPP